MIGMLNTYLGAKGDDLLKKLSSKIANFSTRSGLVIRTSKSFKPEVFLMALITTAQQGKATFNKIAMEMYDLDKSCGISPQALWKRISRKGCMLEQFIGKSIALICSHGVVEAQRHKQKFQRILTEDSSFVKMLKLCSEIFPAHGNKHGSTAGVKLNFIFDLLTGQTVELSTHAATEQDRSIAWALVELLKKGDLVLRDMGYFNVAIFEEIESKCADWLSRVPSSVNLYINGGKSIETLLNKSKSNIIDRQIELTDSRYSARLVAVRRSKKEADEAVRKLKESARKLGRIASKQSLTRARWYLLVTSISKETMTARELGKLYAQRWQIEIIFKAWKQSSNLEKSLSKKSGYQHMLGIFLAEVLRLALTMYCYARLRREGGALAKRISISKLSDWVSTKISKAGKLVNLFKVGPPQRLIMTQMKNHKCQMVKMLEFLC